MESPLSLVVSVSALVVSGFTFWWSNVRDPKKLSLVPLSRIGIFEGPIFALANGGKRDILITGLQVYFETMPDGSRFYPGVSISGGDDGKADLLGAGKLLEFRASFLEKFGANFAQSGRKGDPWPDLHSHYLGIEVEWVDPNGNVHTARVIHSKVGFSDDGKIMGKAPMTKKPTNYNLYAAAA